MDGSASASASAGGRARIAAASPVRAPKAKKTTSPNATPRAKARELERTGEHDHDPPPSSLPPSLAASVKAGVLAQSLWEGERQKGQGQGQGQGHVPDRARSSESEEEREREKEREREREMEMERKAEERSRRAVEELKEQSGLIDASDRSHDFVILNSSSRSVSSSALAQRLQTASIARPQPLDSFPPPPPMSHGRQSRAGTPPPPGPATESTPISTPKPVTTTATRPSESQELSPLSGSPTRSSRRSSHTPSSRSFSLSSVASSVQSASSLLPAWLTSAASSPAAERNFSTTHPTYFPAARGPDDVSDAGTGTDVSPTKSPSRSPGRRHRRADQQRRQPAVLPDMPESRAREGGRRKTMMELKRFTLYETKTRFYLVAFNTSQTRFRILKIDRSPPPRTGSTAAASGAPPPSTTASSSNSHAPTPRDTSPHRERGRARDGDMDKDGGGPGADRDASGVHQGPSESFASLYSSSSSTTGAARSNSVADEPPSNAAHSKAQRSISPLTTRKARSARRGTPLSTSSSSQSRTRTTQTSPTRPAPEQHDAMEPEDPYALNVIEDDVVYSRTQVEQLLKMIDDGNKASGGCKEVGRFFGIVGFIRFTAGYYMVLISKRSVVALIGGHYIYHCDETQLLNVSSGGSKDKSAEEARLLHTFRQVDLSKNFYFSYTYDLTSTLQRNMTDTPIGSPASSSSSFSSSPAAGGTTVSPTTAWGFNEKFIWNHHLLRQAFWRTEKKGRGASEWVLPLVHGFVDQAKLSVFNRTIYVTLIARRSRHFAGARYLKRGVNGQGFVANDVETEQIVSEALTTPFYSPGRREEAASSNSKLNRNRNRFRERKGSFVDHEEEDELVDEIGPNRVPSSRYTSYVQYRGSIPLYWSQDTTNMSPRPPIEISIVDPYFSAAALHFDDLFARYGTPIIVLNLIKSKEKQPRESKLLGAFGECVAYLNQFLPEGKKMQYIAWDMSRASKSHDQDVIGVLEDIAEETVEATKFFHSGPEPYAFSLRTGRALPYRDSILLQNGVCRVNCVDCLDRTNAAQFVIGKAALGHQLHALGIIHHPHVPFDSDAVNMLTEMYHDLGDTIALQYGGSHLVNTMETYRKINQWTSHSRDMLEGLKRYYANSFIDAEKQAAINLFLGVDLNAPDIAIRFDRRRDYRYWYTPSNLVPAIDEKESMKRLLEVARSEDHYWAEYYRPSLFTDLERHHAFKMTAVHQMRHGRFVDFSPFKPRVMINPEPPAPRLIGGVRRWMSLNHKTASRKKTKSLPEPSAVDTPAPAPPDVSTLEGLVYRLTHPAVDEAEGEEYAWYLRQFDDASGFAQKHSISEKDVDLYESSVAWINPDSVIVADSEIEAAPDPALVGYASYTFDRSSSEAKARLYANWLKGVTA